MYLVSLRAVWLSRKASTKLYMVEAAHPQNKNKTKDLDLVYNESVFNYSNPF